MSDGVLCTFVLHVVLRQLTLLWWLLWWLGGCTCNDLRSTIFNERADLRIPTIYSTITVYSRIDCCRACTKDVNCNAVNFNEVLITCELSSVHPLEVVLVANPTVGWDVYTKIDYDYLLMFRAAPGVNTEPYQAYLYGINTTTSDPACQDPTNLSCNGIYRNPLLDSWAILSIKEAKMSFWKGGTEAAYILFNATNKNSTHFFKSKRIIDSTWTTLKDEPAFSKFDFKGWPRNFVINVITACGGAVYTQTIWKERTGVCNHDIQPSYPQFLYSTSTTSGNPHDWIDFERADALTFYVK